MSKKLLLVNPVNPGRKGLTVNVNSRFPPLGLGIVAALTPADWEVRIIDENFDPFHYEEAGLVGLTAFTASAPRAYEIAAIYRRQGVPVVLGGIHASLVTDEASQYADSVVCGEAETVWPQVIADFEAGSLKKLYRASWPELDNVPGPRHDLFHAGYKFASVQTARGCPMDCEFCSVSAFNGRRYRQRPVEDVLNELASIPQKMVFFVDDNIIGYGKEAEQRAISLFNGMVQRGIKKDWFCQASMNFADSDEVLEAARKSGCRMVFLGVEAEDAGALSEVNKKLNLKIEANNFEESFRRIKKHGIAVLGSLIYGMDGDTPAGLQRRTDFILGSGIDVMQTTYLTPLPGTRLFDKLQSEGRLLYCDFPRDWEHYDMTEVVHRPLLMSPEELGRVYRYNNGRLLGWGSIWRKFLRCWRDTGSFVTAMWALNSNINYRNVFLNTRPQ